MIRLPGFCRRNQVDTGAISGQIRIEDMAARYGGEEIPVLLPRTSKVAGVIPGERIREKIQSIKYPYEQDVVR
ncbi:MAG: diguanylate cyclase [Desulfobacterales bacterium]|nr:diguanylate cyclase [Desulfobacterales bacterium]